MPVFSKTITDRSKNIISVQLLELLFIRPASRKRNPIYDKFYQNEAKVFFVFKMNNYIQNEQWNTIICETSTKIQV